MKVLLKQNVRKVGNKGQIVEVAEGYANNSLIPQGFAVVATSGILNKAKSEKKHAAKKEETEKAEFVRMIKKLDGKTVQITKTLTEKGSLFSAIHLKEVLEEVAKTFDEKIPEDLIKGFKDIKEAGTTEVTLQFEKVKGILYISIHG